MAAKIRRDDEVIVLTGKDKVNAVQLRMSCLPARSLLKVSTWLRNIREAGSGPEPTGWHR
ncbi:50S ribosomal protein L24 [Escherichia coli]|nr:50S ribosomal protein L24 [Escherichia coli]